MLDDSRPLDHILIVGAGLAGLALGIGLRKSGYQVTIVERDTVLEDVRSQIQEPLQKCILTISGWSRYPAAGE